MPVITTPQHFPEPRRAAAHTDLSAQEYINYLHQQSWCLSEQHRYQQEVEDLEDGTKRQMH